MSSTIEIPDGPTLTAHLTPNRSGTTKAIVTLPDGSTHTITDAPIHDARQQVADLVCAYAHDHVGHAVRLQVSEPDGQWLIAMHPDGTRQALQRNPTVPNDAGAPATDPGTGAGVDRAVPDRPTLQAHLTPNASGTINTVITFPDGSAHTIADAPLDDARQQVLELVCAYARDEVGHAVGLQVSDPDGQWLIAIHPDGTRQGLQPNPPTTHQTAGGPVPNGAVTRTAGTDAGAGLDRGRLHPPRHGRVPRVAARWREALKNPQQRQEEDADARLARRYTLTDTNYIVIASNKGGPGKTTVSLALGDALASRLPNQRVLAVDLNAGGGALGAAATEDRQARFSLLQLHHDRAKIDRHSKLEPYVASLPSGLDLLAVPPDPAHALAITTEHYQQLFDELLAPNYNLILLDTSPDITSPVTQWALQRGTQLIIVIEQGYLSGSVVMHSLRYLLNQPTAGAHGKQATIVINRVLNDPRAGSIHETEHALRDAHAGPIIRIPWDLDLRAQIDTGNYTLDHVRRRATRLPIKQLALEVTTRLI